MQELSSTDRYSFVGGPFGSNLTSADYVDAPGVPVIRGTNLDGKNCRFVDDEFVFVSSRKAESLIQNMAYPGDLVFTQRGTLGQVAEIPIDARYPRYVVSQSQMKVSLDPSKGTTRFLYHYFRSSLAVALLQTRIQATGVPHINLGLLKEFPVLLPPLPEQQRIAAILDKADAIRRKRQQAIELTENLLRSAFLEMFGDPATNPKGWATCSLAEVCEVGGGLQVTTARATNPISLPYLRVANVYRDALDLREMKEIQVTESEAIRATLKDGDVLVVEGHGNPAELGRAAVWSGEIARCTHQNHLIRVRANPQRIRPIFLSAYLNSSSGRAQMLRLGKTTSGLNTISANNVRGVTLLLPPLERQQTFESVVLGTRRLRTRLLTTAHQDEALFSSLTERAFAGGINE